MGTPYGGNPQNRPKSQGNHGIVIGGSGPSGTLHSVRGISPNEGEGSPPGVTPLFAATRGSVQHRCLEDFEGPNDALTPLGESGVSCGKP